mmetsp:Transcript_15265/g.45235  ORF Transcript_15265/g.45235 Transcript_15265/m.45235 type:complete len:214 (+) Transcript_15265:26-667(+)
MAPPPKKRAKFECSCGGGGGSALGLGLDGMLVVEWWSGAEEAGGPGLCARVVGRGGSLVLALGDGSGHGVGLCSPRLFLGAGLLLLIWIKPCKGSSSLRGRCTKRPKPLACRRGAVLCLWGSPWRLFSQSSSGRRGSRRSHCPKSSVAWSRWRSASVLPPHGIWDGGSSPAHPCARPSGWRRQLTVSNRAFPKAASEPWKPCCCAVGSTKPSW